MDRCILSYITFTQVIFDKQDTSTYTNLFRVKPYSFNCILKIPVWNVCVYGCSVTKIEVCFLLNKQE